MPDPSGSSMPASRNGPSGLSNARRWSVVGLLFVASLINYLDRFTISISLPLISHDLHIGPTDKGLLLSGFFWSYAFMQIPIGVCADRFNLRWLYAGAFALWSFAQGLAGAAKTLSVLLLTRVLLGVGESIYLPGGTKIVTLLFPPEKSGLPAGLFDFGTRCGMALGGLIIPLLLIRFGWRMSFVLIGAAASLWLIPWFAVFPADIRKAGIKQQRTGNRASLPAPQSVLRQLALNRDLLGICLGFFCFDYYWYLLVTWLPDYLVTVRRLTVLRAGLYSAAPFLVFGACEPIGGWIADRLIHYGWDETRTRKGILTIAFVTGLLLIAAAHATSASTAIILVIGASFVGLATGNLIVILQCCAPPEKVGLWTGIENFFGNIAGVLAPLITGILISRTGSYSPGFELAASVLVAGLISYWLVVGKLERKTVTSD
ncbi:MAG TPA: MFS transporter [Terriglobia bacterium]|nr:MFS transporter [Terriglobia bacterium]